MQYYCCRVDLSSQRTSCCCKGANVIAAESCGVTKLRWVCRHSVRCADHLKISSLANTSVSGVERRERKITTDPSVNLQLARGVVTRQVATFFRLWSGLEFHLRDIHRKRGIDYPRFPALLRSRLRLHSATSGSLSFIGSDIRSSGANSDSIFQDLFAIPFVSINDKFLEFVSRTTIYLVSYRDLIKFAFSFFLYICIYTDISKKVVKKVKMEGFSGVKARVSSWPGGNGRRVARNTRGDRDS